ncbi:MAG: GatB/YqeY domain-containing protein [Planctomycetota bacterium]
MSESADDLLTRLQTDMKAAMKAGEKEKLAVIRMLLSEARTADLQNPPSTPEKLVAAYGKRLSKSRDEYQKLGDDAQVQQLDAELEIVGTYLPKQADSGETVALVNAFLAEHPEFGPSDIGRATGMFMKSSGGAVDAKAANGRIREVLSQK